MVPTYTLRIIREHLYANSLCIVISVYERGTVTYQSGHFDMGFRISLAHSSLFMDIDRTLVRLIQHLPNTY